MLLAGLATAANAQDVTPANPKTKVEVRDNGTVKTTTKTGKMVKRGAKKTTNVVRGGAQKTSRAAKEGTSKLEEKTE